MDESLIRHIAQDDIPTHKGHEVPSEQIAKPSRPFLDGVADIDRWVTFFVWVSGVQHLG